MSNCGCQNNNNNIPDWKSDFPIKKREAGYVSRRDFIKVITFFSGLMAFANIFIPLFNYFYKKKPIKDYFVCHTNELEIGNQKTCYINGDHRNPYMLIRMDENKWKVYEQKCTHLSCSVIYQHDKKIIECPCHHGYFNPENGDVLQGPPPRPLAQLAVVVKDDRIYVQDYAYEKKINHKIHHS